MSVQNIENKDESEEAGSSSTASAVALVQQTGDIFKLDIDCLEEVFDFLPLKDLVSVRRTCKRLQQVAGYCFQRQYASVKKTCTEDGIYMDRVTNVNGFIPFIDRISFTTRKPLEMFCINQSKFMRLKEMTFHYGMITPNDAEIFKDKLKKIETLQLDGCKISGEFYKTILKFCMSLKRLIIKYGGSLLRKMIGCSRVIHRWNT